MGRKIPADIFTLLDQEDQLCRELLTIMDQEQAAVVAMEMNELTALSRRKTEQIETIREIDRQLQQQVEELTGQPGGNAVRLSELAGLTSGEEKRQLEERQQQLVALRQDIAAKSVINHHFVEDTKRHLHEAITLITTAATGQDQAGAYNRPGRGKRPHTGRPSMISRSI
ncbi:MAG: flagellar protein FlgN [Desulfurivibrio sp.]|nr:flagellar protein FlgN [Desulfurivibrio sp.]